MAVDTSVDVKMSVVYRSAISDGYGRWTYSSVNHYSSLGGIVCANHRLSTDRDPIKGEAPLDQ